MRGSRGDLTLVRRILGDCMGLLSFIMMGDT